VTGSPKLRSAADLSVVIRTLVASPAGLTIGAGGAIVAGSDPDGELSEMPLEARALLAAVGGMVDAGRVAMSARPTTPEYPHRGGLADRRNASNVRCATRVA
jgi:para-aminobenzoate synthetase